VQVRKALDRVGPMPELHAVLRRDIRRAKVQKFPYNIYYRIGADRMEVIAVVHGRRDPSAWKGRA
jgi:plasmid stabilization system protein ParE